jgi:DNA-directed RNA polymerase specialized sigma24 family protein
MPKRVAVPVARSKAPEPLPDGSEDEVVARGRLGDVRAWDLVVRHHQEIVFRVVLLLTGDPDASVDTAKTAFIRAYRALPELPLGTSIRPWLIGIASSVARAQRRAIERWYERDSRSSVVPVGARLTATRIPGWEQAASMHPDHRDQLRSAFELLTWDERTAIAARYLVGASRTEAATLLGTEQDEVEGPLRAALDHLRRALADTSFRSLPPDHLGWLVTVTIVGQFPWAPDIAPEVTDRLVRDAITYPEQFGPSRRVVSSRS